MTMATYLDESTLPFPFCPGCGHGTILKQLDAALVQLQLDPHNVVLVTDIGCQGLSDRYFTTNAFHGLHGRSLTYATGIKLANPDLHVIVLIGDGGCGIGGHHLLNAARRNIGLTVLVFNNLNFGMTGGEHSVTTPSGGQTVTSRYGNLEQPLDICATVGVNGGGFVARTTTFERDLTDLLVTAIQHDGFSLVDIWELCTAYYAPANALKKQTVYETMQRFNFEMGVLYQQDRPEYSRAVHAAAQEQHGQSRKRSPVLSATYSSALTTSQGCIIAGAAGQKIGSAAAAFCQGAIRAGLWASQHNDYPVTVKTGHSVAEVILSPEPILHMGIEQPDAMLVLFSEGLRKEQARIARLSPEATLYVHADLLPVETPARVVTLDFGPTRQKKTAWALMALGVLLREMDLYPFEALYDAVSGGPYAAENQAALQAVEQVVLG